MFNDDCHMATGGRRILFCKSFGHAADGSNAGPLLYETFEIMEQLPALSGAWISAMQQCTVHGTKMAFTCTARENYMQFSNRKYLYPVHSLQRIAFFNTGTLGDSEKHFLLNQPFLLGCGKPNLHWHPRDPYGQRAHTSSSLGMVNPPNPSRHPTQLHGHTGAGRPMNISTFGASFSSPSKSWSWD